jgi:hypothetical protein
VACGKKARCAKTIAEKRMRAMFGHYLAVVKRNADGVVIALGKELLRVGDPVRSRKLVEMEGLRAVVLLPVAVCELELSLRIHLRCQRVEPGGLGKRLREPSGPSQEHVSSGQSHGSMLEPGEHRRFQDLLLNGSVQQARRGVDRAEPSWGPTAKLHSGMHQVVPNEVMRAAQCGAAGQMLRTVGYVLQLVDCEQRQNVVLLISISRLKMTFQQPPDALSLARGQLIKGMLDASFQSQRCVKVRHQVATE